MIKPIVFKILLLIIINDMYAQNLEFTGTADTIPVFTSLYSQEDHIFFIKKNNKWGAQNIRKNKVVLPFKYDSILINSTSFGKYLLKDAEGWSCLKFNKKGQKFKPTYPTISKKTKYDVDYDNNEIQVIYNQKVGIVNTKYELLVPIMYDKISSRFRTDGKILEKDGKKGLYINKKIALNAIYDDIPNLMFKSYEKDADKYVLAEKDGKIGVFDYDGNNIVPIAYDTIDYHFFSQPIFGDGLKESSICFILESNKKYGVANSSGNIIIPLEYNAITPFDVYNDKASYAAKKDQKYGILDATNKTLLPFEHDFIWNDDTDYFSAIRNDQMIIYDKYFKEQNSVDEAEPFDSMYLDAPLDEVFSVFLEINTFGCDKKVYIRTAMNQDLLNEKDVMVAEYILSKHGKLQLKELNDDTLKKGIGYVDEQYENLNIRPKVVNGKVVPYNFYVYYNLSNCSDE